MDNILFRVDFGNIIGYGHIMRCLNLADFLEKYFNIFFFCKRHEGANFNFIPKKFKLIEQPINQEVSLNTESWLGTTIEEDYNNCLNIIKDNKIDIVITDHYTLDYKWESKIRDVIKKLVVINDLFNNKHCCDCLINPNFYLKYDYNENSIFKLKKGFKYIILNKRIKDIPYKIKENVNRINIFFGGSDLFNVTEKIVDLLLNEKNKIMNFDNLQFDIIIGPSNKNFDSIYRKIKNLKQFKIHKSLPNKQYLDLLNESDLSIGGSGSSTYERMYLAIPTIAITLVENQLLLTDSLSKIQAIYYVGNYDSFSELGLITLLNDLIINPYKLKERSEYCKKLIDGKGLERILKLLLK